jgi:hypothetical protein
MKTTFATLALLFLAVLLTTPTWACDIQTGIVPQTFDPVYWAAGGSLGAGNDFAFGILKNASSKTVVAVQAGWVMWAGCSAIEPAAVQGCKTSAEAQYHSR